MTADQRPGSLGRLAGNIDKAWRLLRRVYHERSETGSLDVSRIEHQMVFSVYQKTAADLSLEIYEMGRAVCIAGHGKRFRIWGDATEFDRSPLWAITEDKLLAKSLFQKGGLPVPAGRVFDRRDADGALAYALSGGRPCVVKPASDTCCGTGVTTNLSRPRDVRRAFRFAALFSPQVLIEEFVAGDSYRFLVHKGKCLSVVRRELPGVTGNGTWTVRRLADGENRNRIRTSDWRAGDSLWMPLPINRSALRHLKRQGLGWSYVPAPGERIHLAGASNFRFGCTYTEVIHQTHPEQLRVAQEATAIIGMDLAGVDIISPDIEAPACSIIEINTSPGLPLHYLSRNSEALTDPLRTILMDYFELTETGSVRDALPPPI